MEIKEIKQTIYVADDGMTFKTEEECVRYEHEKRMKWCVDYVRTHAIMTWFDEWTGIAGYFGSGGCTLFLIEVDETLCGFGNEFLAFPAFDDINHYLGKKVFIRCEDEYLDSEWHIEMTLDEAIADMEYSMKTLKKWKEA